jgi:hypothetical protein
VALEDPKAILKGNAFQKPSEKGVRHTHIVKEAMRLYPPTHRVHRDFYEVTAAADIEECHRLDLV